MDSGAENRGAFEKWWDRFAYVFNRTALGVGTLGGFYLVYEEYYLQALFMFALIPVYFRLRDYYDAP